MQKQIDFSLKVVIVSILLTLLLAVSNTYLALKVGLLTAASIPAAILSMGIMKVFRESTIYEHNLVQTTASAGEAIAGGIGYSLPAFIILGFWHDFHYGDTVLLALIGGVVGVLFSAIIRRPLLQDQSLKFPEAKAISEVLKLKEAKVLGLKEMLLGGGLAALLEFFQNTGMMFAGGLRFFAKGSLLFGLGVGLSPALIGAGYIVGIRVGASLLLGAVLSYLCILPALSHGASFSGPLPMDMRYVGVGAMLMAAILTLVKLLRPLYDNVKTTLSHLHQSQSLPFQDRDLSKRTITVGLLCTMLVLAVLFNHLFCLPRLGFHPLQNGFGIVFSLVFVLLVGFFMAIICGYFSGLVGVSASPGSSILIGGLILAALLTHGILSLNGLSSNAAERLVGEAITVVIASVLMQIACIANDTMQDLKVGQNIGASPRKQQMMLIFGVVIASLIVPLVMHILYNAYGIAGQMPRSGMDPNQSLAAPPAAVMAALTAAIFEGAIPLKILSIGALTIVVIAVLQRLFKKEAFQGISFIGIGIGMYLPLMSSTPLMIGALLSWIVARRVKNPIGLQRKVLLACGFVAGATLMDVVLAVPVALHSDGHALSFVLPHLAVAILSVLGMLVFFGLVLKQGRD